MCDLSAAAITLRNQVADRVCELFIFTFAPPASSLPPVVVVSALILMTTRPYGPGFDSPRRVILSDMRQPGRFKARELGVRCPRLCMWGYQ